MRYKQYCKDYENIENYEKAAADNFKCWCCHHRLETHNSDGERRTVDITAAELIALRMYYNRPAEELIFLTTSEHSRLHMKGKKHALGCKPSEETKKKLSDARKGKRLSEETKKKMSKPKSEEHKKKLSAAKKGKTSNMKGKHLSEEAKNKISESRKGKRWYNNGKINIMSKKCPEGFAHGMLK